MSKTVTKQIRLCSDSKHFQSKMHGLRNRAALVKTCNFIRFVSLCLLLIKIDEVAFTFTTACAHFQFLFPLVQSLTLTSEAFQISLNL
jgi:hypothetical protein